MRAWRAQIWQIEKTINKTHTHCIGICIYVSNGVLGYGLNESHLPGQKAATLYSKKLEFGTKVDTE